MSASINIVSFDIPYPANYGGVIDVFYKIKYLHRTGVAVHLHCFEYGREHSAELEKICAKVYYYPRKTGLLNNLSALPYTVRSRISEDLAKNLLTNDYPIIFEVLHTCFLMDDPRFKKRFKIYRHSNIEHDYYRHLALAEKNVFNKMYLSLEASRLKKFEKIIAHADLILSVSTRDLQYFKTNYPKVRSEYLPSFHPNEEIKIKEGKGDYILYQGNLSVSENYEAASWLIKNIYSKLKYPVKIAGLDPPSFLVQQTKKYKHIELIPDPSESEMNKLIENAQIHTLYTAQGTGLKLKLLNVLFKGRFVIANADMVEGTHLKSLGTFLVANSIEEYLGFIEENMGLTFESDFLSEREALLSPFSCEENIHKLLKFIG